MPGLSVAGGRKGLSGERSGLFMEQIRLIKEMRNATKQLSMRRTDEHIRPRNVRYMVWENVYGTFTSGTPRGEDFRIVLEETARVVDENAVIPGPPNGRWSQAGCIVGDGYSIAYRLHDSQWWGVPQRRKRVCMVADFEGQTAGEILFEYGRETSNCKAEQTVGSDREESRSKVRTVCKSVSGNTEQIGTERQGTTPPSERDVNRADTEIVGINEPCNWDGSQTAPTLTARNAGGNQRMPDKENFQAVISYGLDRAAFNQGQNAKFNFSAEEEKIGSCLSRGPGAVCAYSVVRRLTPIEVERLQGFPDDWTNIGEWRDSRGKLRKESSDASRYTALGNSIALPFWAWMADRMIAVLKRDGIDKPTMASLFDGIGGFPLVYSRCGCKPIWASEIEDFCIAVTKRRFPDGDENEERSGEYHPTEKAE